MIVLDTNVVSELLRSTLDSHVMTWLGEQPRLSLFTTTVTRAEILYGIRVLPAGRRRRNLLDVALAIFNDDLTGQVLSFDNDAADAYAEIAESRRSAGKPMSQCDAMIAAMARSRGAGLATRNVKDFVGCGIDVVNPWSP